MKEYNKYWKIAAFLLLFFLVTASAAQAVIKVNSTTIDDEDPNVITSFGDEIYEWKDIFENGQKIDMSESEDYIRENGVVRMAGTYDWWTDPSWTRAKIVELDSSLSGDDARNVAVKIIVEHDSDMRSDYGDVRFRYNGGWLDYWIETRNTVDAIIWVKIPTLSQGKSYMYMFYGKPTAQDEGDYWSVFDENSWQKEHVNDERVTNHMNIEGAWDPDICFGQRMINGHLEDTFLVTWEEGTAFWPIKGTIFKQQIRGCFYNTDGEATSNRFDIVDEPFPDNPLMPYRYENPCVAYDGDGKFIVTFEHYLNPIDNNHKERRIEGVIVTEPREYGSEDRFLVSNAENTQNDPRIGYDSNRERFLVVWEDARNGYYNYDIYGRFFDSDGNALDIDFSLVEGTPHQAANQVEPWIAFNNINNQYMVVWEESTDQPDTGPFEIWGQLFDWQGSGLGSPQRISQTASSSNDYNFPSVAFCENTEKFLVAWNQDDISSGDWNGNIYGRFVDENGDLDPNIITIATGQYCRTDVVPYLETSFFVSYDNWESGNPDTGDIWGKMINNDGTVNQYTIQLSDDGPDAADWVNIGSSGSKLFIAWEDVSVYYGNGFDGMPDIYFNVWSLNTPSGSDVSYDIGDEKSLILNAHIVSIPIAPVNWKEWYEFDAEKSGNVDFDIVDGNNPNNVLLGDISPGRNIESIGASSIRLRARFSRNNPSSDPSLDEWSVTYYGKDEQDPETWVSDTVGVQGLNNWWKSETVKIYLDAKDYPEDSGSGIYKTYYRIKPEGSGWGSTEEYNQFIELVAPEDTKNGIWDVNFWSEDNAGNVEDNTKEQNFRNIKIDWGIPFVTITEPENEQQLEMGFWVRTTAGDNVGLEKVEFDCEDFGEREGLPFEDTEPPYEWYCDVEQMGGDDRSKSSVGGITAQGVNLKIRAYAYDYVGLSYYSEIVVYVTDWDDDDDDDVSKSKTIKKIKINDRPLLNILKLSFAFDNTLDIEIPIPNNADSIKFEAKRMLFRKGTVIWDEDLSDGCSASFDIPTGIYKITTYAYKDDVLIDTDIITRVLYISR